MRDKDRPKILGPSGMPVSMDQAGELLLPRDKIKEIAEDKERKAFDLHRHISHQFREVEKALEYLESILLNVKTLKMDHKWVENTRKICQDLDIPFEDYSDIKQGLFYVKHAREHLKILSSPTSVQRGIITKQHERNMETV